MTRLRQFFPTSSNSWLLSFGLFLAVNVLVYAEEKRGGKPVESQADITAIRESVDSYVAAYNRGDAKGVAAHWSDTGEWINPAGGRVRGGAAIAKALETLFAENKGVRIEVLNASIRQVTTDVAVEEGKVRVIHPTAGPSDSDYLAIHVKRDGKWKLDSVHETEIPEQPAASAALQELGWLVGDWGDDSPTASVEANVTWTKNKTFLNYSFKVSVPGADPLEGSQIIGWDPNAGTIRSWMFDSDGGFGEGIWTKKDDTWVIKFRQVLPDGRIGSATNIYKLVDGNTFTWKSIGRKVDAEFLPNTEEVTITRKGVNQPPNATAAPKKKGKE